MTITYQRPYDQETWREWLQRRSQEERHTATYAFYINDRLVCTRKSVIQSAQDFSTLCRERTDSIHVVAERKDGSVAILGRREVGGQVEGASWFLRAAGM